MNLALFEPVEVTDMRVVAKASIVLYREISTGRLFIDPSLPLNPLFRLGDVKGEDGKDGVDGVVDPLVIQAVELATVSANEAASDASTAANTAAAAANSANNAALIANQAALGTPKNTILEGSTLNTPRAGVVAGLLIQWVNRGLSLIGKIVVFRGMLKLVSTATGTGSMVVNIGGLVFTFPNITIAASTQYVHFEVTAHIISGAVGFASVCQSIALNGVAATAVQANNVAQSGSIQNTETSINFKSPTTSQVTTLFAVFELL